MKGIVFLIGFSLGVTITTMNAQDLPSTMYFAENEHILYTNGRNASGFYDESTFREIQLWFDQPDFWQLMKNNYTSKTDIPATMIVENDTFYNVGVRFKGNTSYQQVQNSDKKSFNITLDAFVAGQDIDGYSTINLNNAFEDASFMREVSYLHQIRRHIPAAKANFVHLTINGINWGVYPNVQQINGDYLEEWFFSNDGTRWRADRPSGGGGPGGGGWGDGTAGLNYLGADTTTYKQYYTLKSTSKTNPWDDLVNTCNVLNTTPLSNLETEISEVMDLDRTLWFLASEIAFSDDDSYVFKGKMDYYLYWDPETQRMTPLEFDGNSAMKSNATNWGVFYNETKVNYPLLNRLLAVPSIRQRYLAHFRTLMADEMNTTEFNALVDSYDALINAAVLADTKKLYTNAQYNTEKQTIKNFVNTHRNNLLNNSEINAVGPSINGVSTQTQAGEWADPAAYEAVTVRANITSPVNGISEVTLFYCPGAYGHFAKTTMYDDGQHNDGAASDGVFGASIPGFATGTLVRFYVQAAANNTAKTLTYYPVGAEHDVFYYYVGAAWVLNPPVVINEVMASNATTAADEAGEYEDWIELHNLTNAAVDLTEYALSDNPTNLRKWVFPAGTVIPANGYLIIWADEDADQGPLHASFKLSASGETLSLVDPQSAFLDNISFDEQVTDQGYARLPNGTGPFVIKEPTFGAFNGTVPTVEPDAARNAEMAISPNPSHDQVQIVLNGENVSGQLSVYNMLGELVTEMAAAPVQALQVADWTPGVYFVQWGSLSTKLIIAQ
ncbi:MAG TPA: CotH kinase family protein [Saprospiraceae bacterium]|nr:CotH kinase family protein [Saprospiraceae bacterium]